LSSSFVPGCDHPRMPQTTPVMTVQLRCQRPEIHSVTSAFDNRAKMKSGTATKTIFGGSDTLVQTCSSKPWGTGLLIGYSAALRNKPVQVKVEYERPSLDSATCTNLGYKPAFDHLKGKLDTEFGTAVRVIGGAGRTSSFEIYADGKLLHSKLGGTGGKVDTSAEYQALVDKLKSLVGTPSAHLDARGRDIGTFSMERHTSWKADPLGRSYAQR